MREGAFLSARSARGTRTAYARELTPHAQHARRAANQPVNSPNSFEEASPTVTFVWPTRVAAGGLVEDERAPDNLVWRGVGLQEVRTHS